MRISYFFSGFDTEVGFPENIAQSLKRDIAGRELLVLVASAPYGHEKTDRYAAVAQGWFEKAGIRFQACHVLDSRTQAPAARSLIRAASCIFLMGGDTLQQFAFLKSQGLADAIREAEAVVAGMSAGAINMAVTSLCTEEEHTPGGVRYGGIGRADITIEPHFSKENAVLIKDLMRISEEHTVYAMCDNSAIIVRDGAVSYMGEIYRIRDAHMERAEA